MTPVYLIGSGVVALVWLIFYFLRADLRKKMMLSSIVGGFFGGFSEAFFVPSYWDPRFFIFKIPVPYFHLDLDSFIFSFFLAGMASVPYQVLFNRPLFDTHRVPAKIIYVAVLIFFSHLLIPQVNVIYFSIGCMVVGGGTCFLLDKNLGIPFLINALLVFTFFTFSYLIFWQLFSPLAASYNYPALSGIHLLGIPIEELSFYFAVGSFWCFPYELLGNSRLRSKLRYFYD